MLSSAPAASVLMQFSSLSYLGSFFIFLLFIAVDIYFSQDRCNDHCCHVMEISWKNSTRHRSLLQILEFKLLLAWVKLFDFEESKLVVLIILYFPYFFVPLSL